MKVVSIPVNRINPAPYNPRKNLQPGDPEFDKLDRSLNEFGCVEPLVWNKRTGNLVGGHQRLKILIKRGAAEADVSVVDLPPEKEKILNIALNKIGGDWEPPKLAQLLEELTKTPQIDVELTGFAIPDVNELIAQVLYPTDGRDEDFDVEAALAPESPAITEPSELIELDTRRQHRLLCGDSSNPDDLAKVLGEQKVDMLFCDPPYNVNYYGGKRPVPEKARPKQSRRWKRIYSDNLSQKQYAAWLSRVMQNVSRVLLPGAAFYIWNGHRQFGPMHLMLEQIGMNISCVVTWAKPSFAIGYGDYNQQTEFCLYGWQQGNGSHRWYGPSNESTLWQVKRDPTKTYQHPTQKPLELAERAIRNSTRPGQLVLDTFLGSGTTLIAAQRTGRQCVGLEIDPHYCDVIVRRYIAYAGDDVVPPQLLERYHQQPK